MTVAERLKSLRKDRGLTQNELAGHLNLGQTTIAAYENGTHDPQVFALTAYAEYFDCSLEYLLGLDEGRSYPAVTYAANTEKEADLLRIYRELDDEMKEFLSELANTILKFRKRC